MGRSNLGLALAALASLGGAFALMAMAAQPAPAAATPASAASPAATNPKLKSVDTDGSQYAAKQVLKSFLYGQDEGREIGQAAGKAEDLADPRFKYTLDSIIATIPDPIESGLSGIFDDEMDSIQRAAEAAGFVLERFKIPWPTPSERAGQGGNPRVDQSESGALSDGAAGQKTRNEPGVILFRDDKAHRLLLVYLIGETPTSGIHKEPFRKALGQVCELRGLFKSAFPRVDCGDNCPPVSVLGPTFSGSQDSLMFALHDWRVQDKRCSGVKFRIISGSATTIDQSRFQKSDNLDFAATMIPDRLLMRELSGWIQEHGLGTSHGDRVAILSESNTAYGELGQLKTNSKARRAPFSNALWLKFPIHIAELEKARQRAGAQASEPLTLSTMLRDQNLPLAVGANRERRDIVPVYSESEANSLELVLGQLLDAIKQQRVECVIIAATDIEDTIMLARQVRQSSPNVTLISLNANVLYLHSDVNPQLHGMLVASTYPLLTANQVWTNPFWGARWRAQFPTDVAEGVYNAMLALVAGDVAMLDYSEPLGAGQLAPPLWITVVGSGGIWPLAALHVDDRTHYMYRRAEWSSAYPSYAWPGWPAAARLEILQLTLLVAALLFVALTVLASAYPSLLPAAVEQYFAGASFDDVRLRRRVYQVVVVVALVAALGIVLHYVSFDRFHHSSTVRADDAAAALLAFRASSLGSRVSPLTPLLMALGAGLCLLLGALRRTRLTESRQLSTSFLSFGTPSFGGVADLEARVKDGLSNVAFASPVWWLAMIALAAAYASIYWVDGRWPIDGVGFAAAFFALSMLAYLGIAHAIYRLTAIWLATRRLLHRLYWHPSRPGYEKYRAELPAGSESAVDMLSSTPALTAVEVGLAQVRRMISMGAGEPAVSNEATGQIIGQIIAMREPLAGAQAPAERALQDAMTAYGLSRWHDEIVSKRELEARMAEVSKTVAEIFEPQWRGANSLAQEAGDKEQRALRCGEIYIASRTVDFLRQVMPQLQTLAYSATVGMLLMLVAVSSYPFPMWDNLLWFSWAVVVITGGAIVWMFVSANRDRVMSLISGTTPGSVAWNSSLLMQIATHALIPLIVLAGAAFPERLSRVVSWLGGVLGGGH